MKGPWGWQRLSIFGRTFLLMLAALTVAELIGVALVVNHSGDAPAYTLNTVARALRQPEDSGPDGRGPGPAGPSPNALSGDPGGQGGPGGPHGPPDAGFGGPPPNAPGAPPMSEFTRNVDQNPPDAAGLKSAPVLRTALARLLHVDVLDLVVYATAADESKAMDGAGGSIALRGRWIAGRHLRSGNWQIIEHRPEGFPNALQRRALLLCALGIAALMPLAWLFAHALSAPILRFRDAAVRLGRDTVGTTLPREGPVEMLEAIDAFNTMQARLSRMLQERTHMVGAIAHDLRTPLTRLAFRLDGLPAPLGEKVSADIQEMKSMIVAALDFIRDRSLNSNSEQLDFRLLVESIVDDQSDLGHDVTLQAGLPITLTGNRVGLRRLVVNLVDNALKYGERARLRLAVAEDRCLLEVDDDGPGIPEQMQQRVFDPFFRIEASRNRDTGGIGLGLASVHAIVMDHAGDISLGNRKGGGLRVSVWLPVARG